MTMAAQGTSQTSKAAITNIHRASTASAVRLAAEQLNQ